MFAFGKMVVMLNEMQASLECETSPDRPPILCSGLQQLGTLHREEWVCPRVQ